MIGHNFYKKQTSLISGISPISLNKIIKSGSETGNPPEDSIASISNPQEWHNWQESKYWVPNGNCTGTFRRDQAILELIFKQVHYEITQIVDKSKYPPSIDKRVWFNDLNNLINECVGHPVGTHTVYSSDYSYRGGSIDVLYFTFGPDNCTQGKCKEGDDQRIHPERIFTDDQVDGKKFDWLRSLLLWRRLLQVFPSGQLMIDVRIFNYAMNQLYYALASTHSTYYSLMQSLGINNETMEYLKRKVYADSPGNFNHHTHSHLWLKNPDWEAFKTADWYYNTSWFPMTYCVNEWCEGSHAILFPVKSRSNMVNKYPAKCDGKYWVDVQHGHWDSGCSTGWTLIEDCKYLGKTIENCPTKEVSSLPDTLVNCRNSACAGVRSGIYPIANGAGKTTESSDMNVAKMMCCKGQWAMNVKGDNWEIKCDTGEFWISPFSQFFGSMRFPKCF